jgi:glyoxylase-like metal-dependent hydrolase (beta-lactamase superfamily II)
MRFRRRRSIKARMRRRRLTAAGSPSAREARPLAATVLSFDIPVPRSLRWKQRPVPIVSCGAMKAVPVHWGSKRGVVPAERLLEGQEPSSLARDILVIPVPGHTRGHVVFLYRGKFLFTGDHLAWSDKRGGLIPFRDVAWYSWPEQIRSMARLLDYRFEWVLPGHGHRVQRPAQEMRDHLTDCIRWMETRR